MIKKNNLDMERIYRQDSRNLFVKLSVLVILLFSTGYIYSQSEAKLLERAYKEKSTTKLKDFFIAWNQDVLPITDVELSTYNDTIQQTYKSFISFYKPHRLDSIGRSEWGNDIYKNVDFLIVQNTVKIYFADKVYYSEQEIEEYIVDEINRRWSDNDSIKAIRFERLKNKDGTINDWYIEWLGPDSYEKRKNRILTDSIMNFRPAVRCDGKIPIFLTKKYDEIINSFLGNNYLPLGTGGIMNPARSKGESEKRKKFLENYVKIFYGHWGGYWQLLSYPEAYSITFDREMKYARIDFGLVYQGGEAFLKNENGVWRLISSKITWIT